MTVVATLSSLGHSKCEFEAIFNFVDSNSDTGGFWAAFPAQPEPYGMTYFKRPVGRATDGRLIVGFSSPYLKSIGSDYKHGANFATLASTVLLPNTSLFVTGNSSFSRAIQLNQMKAFKTQVEEFHHSSDQQEQKRLPSLDIFGKSLYTFHIGQNDFTSNLAAIGVGGVKQYLPLVSQIAAVVDNNNLLKEALSQTRGSLPNASLVYVDTSSVLLELFRHPASHGLKYGTKSCCGYGGGAYNFDPQVFCGNTKVINGKSVTATACSDPYNYVSWDGVHATEAANKLTTLAILNGTFSDPPLPFEHFCDLHRIA
ncbi:GDSL esterase/lipase [Pyrus ussuriensis x Pyrus communis]|uniref:GDSL esterase/lipase n=1 Tax=Pyrus ussuriensis x Pyrus communis TaxID=2448454 RepID=A0A5N5EY09_9ROSA|nr:GDSL esterase/lipase [Pyrus ussuriensis x Pyrus communis]